MSPILGSQVSDLTAFEQATAWWNPIDWVKDAWNGLTGFGKTLASPVKWLIDEAGDGYDWAFDKVGDGFASAFSLVGLDGVGRFLDERVIEQIGSEFKSTLLREIQWIEKLPDRIERFGSNFFSDFWNDGGFWEGFGKWLGRNAINILEIAGVPELAEQAFDNLKFNTRSLTEREISVAKSVFGNSINYDLVRIDELSFSIPILSGIRGGDRPFTTFHTINTWGSIDDATLIHELTHIWQYENKGAIYIPEALSGQQNQEIPGTYPPGIDPPNTLGYRYGGATELRDRLNSGRGITTFNLEQQSEIVEHYFKIRSDSNLSNDPYLTLYAHFVKEVSTLSQDHLSMLPTDAGDTLNNALPLNSSLFSTLNSTLTLRESVGGPRFSWNGWLPSISNDGTDFYRLNLTSGNLNLALTGMSADADLRVIQDANGNGMIDFGEEIDFSNLGAAQDEFINLTGLAPGDYFVEVFQFDGITNYNLSIST